MTHRSILDFTGAFRDSVCAGIALGNGYRWYLPALMRFNAPDSLSPFGAGGGNPYAYCHDDPINRNDPTGHIGWFAATNDTRMFVTRNVEHNEEHAISAREASGAANRTVASGHEPAPQVRRHAVPAPGSAVPHVERTMIAAKKALPYYFYFVLDQAETIQTLEGPRQAEVGDVVLTGIKGEQWPMRFSEFNARYDFVGAAGVATPSAVPTKVKAEQMSGPFTVTPPWSETPLFLNTGDIRVAVLGDSRNVWGVDHDIFFETYDILEG
ncbi:RHS repeat-associated core domain-containing protein [Trinickia diaoshuihuensis]|uniref:RHS repeat-associated core domain-containing protein n=1 Tax=Trinickia diaoshuihuensis TaxID=2292265 RepID=UPI000E234B5A|nr:RHS repeat-associated core domain-containing protein [Trinickia diaoshuihuensis]